MQPRVSRLGAAEAGRRSDEDSGTGFGGSRRIEVSAAFSPSRSDQNRISKMSAAPAAMPNGAAKAKVRCR